MCGIFYDKENIYNYEFDGLGQHEQRNLVRQGRQNYLQTFLKLLQTFES